MNSHYSCNKALDLWLVCIPVHDLAYVSLSKLILHHHHAFLPLSSLLQSRCPGVLSFLRVNCTVLFSELSHVVFSLSDGSPHPFLVRSSVHPFSFKSQLKQFFLG